MHCRAVTDVGRTTSSTRRARCLHNSLSDARDIVAMKVRVLVRARPLLRHEEGASAHTLLVDARKATVGVASRHGVASHAVDAVCGVGAPQEEVFEAGRVDELVRAVLDGFHSTIFAYGQTGSGKTFTMEGYDYSAKGGRAPTADFERTPPHKLGVTPRAVQLLFDAVAERNAACAAAGDGASLRVMCSFVQVYREQVLDLLNPALPTSGDMAARGVPVGLKLRWARGREFFVDNLYVGEAPTAADALRLFQGRRDANVRRVRGASLEAHAIRRPSFRGRSAAPSL